MLPETVMSFFQNPYLLVLLAAVAACWLSVKIYPVIIMMAQKKNLMDEPGERSVHEYLVPSYGGAGIFIAFSVLTMSLACLGNCSSEQLGQMLGLMAAVCILFFMGIKGDMIGLDPKKKFISQLLAAGIVILITGVRIESLDGIFGIGPLPYWASVAFTFFVFLLVGNAYNLIDGIDGLAGTIALIACVVFGGFFLVSGNFPMAIASFVLVGALLGFMRFNLSYTKRLFMGDSGSLFLGFLLAYQAVVFLNLNQSENPNAILSNAPVIVLSVLSFPLLDTLRVFILRAREGRSPFSPDRKHIHHRFLAKGLDHKQTTALISLKTLLILAVCWVLQDISINLHLFLILGLAFFVFFVLNFSLSPIENTQDLEDHLARHSKKKKGFLFQHRDCGKVKRSEAVQDASTTAE
jgi:UDP-N-acetylmuramyl pentapeptide phosphotransferase/UDP-N-acetylglucosamine-1-phosphate transferase